MGQVLEMPSTRRKAPTTENGTVPPRRRSNADVRTREHLTEREVERPVRTDTATGTPR